MRHSYSVPKNPGFSVHNKEDPPFRLYDCLVYGLGDIWSYLRTENLHSTGHVELRKPSMICAKINRYSRIRQWHLRSLDTLVIHAEQMDTRPERVPTNEEVVSAIGEGPHSPNISTPSAQ
ncbi:hypothetical protein T265_07347 [Opisthorchis viverrini]|uniref:Uncharacterized protein n=1 Tax=Opisthorchis viverrini TaxID=6198 RepID=A0A074ZHD5_OPIVI|nr:hypothetical protein T265_07347 [Opisthorchis viverrini]KER25122.1 hypothetical protein T265_07347 [Opisthorchis viverrini]